MIQFYDLPSDLQVMIFSHVRKDQIARRIVRRFRLNKWWTDRAWGSGIDLYQFMCYYKWDSCDWKDLSYPQRMIIYDFHKARADFRYKQNYAQGYDGKYYMRYSYDYYKPTKEEEEYFSQPPHMNYQCTRCDTGHIDTEYLKTDSEGDYYCEDCTRSSDEEDDY